MAAAPPGEVAEMDFERLGLLRNPETGRGQWIWGLSITLTYSRHSFLWPLVHQTVEATIEGLEKAWAFFQGCPKRLVLDNFPAAVAGTDPLNPRPTRAFVEYSQGARIFAGPRPRAKAEGQTPDRKIRAIRTRPLLEGRHLHRSNRCSS